jgi:hypothetical protein
MPVVTPPLNEVYCGEATVVVDSFAVRLDSNLQKIHPNTGKRRGPVNSWK